MSYLTLAKGIPDFSKAVFSLWFRAPRESVIAASHTALGGVDGFFYMQSVLPLITFGKPQVNKNYQATAVDVANYQYTPVVYKSYMSSIYTEHEPYDVDPCFIGLKCNSAGSFTLAFNIQMGNAGSYDSLQWVTTEMKIYPIETHPAVPVPGDGWVFFPGGFAVGRATISDVSYINNGQPEVFYVESANYLEPDKWHHLLLSFDVSGSVSMGQPHASSDCKLWYAIDDVDYRNPENLQPYRDDDDGLDPNAILTQNAYQESGFEPGSYLVENQWVPEPSGTYQPDPIPTKDQHFGIPAAIKYVDGIFRVEMAEFQMWTGVTLDTGVTAKRRAFVSAEGKPVDPVKPANPDDPDDDRTPAEKLLGKKPEILLHGSNNWKTGYNTGTTGIEENSEGEIVKIPEGQFKPTAKIERYKPDPSLEDSTA